MFGHNRLHKQLIKIIYTQCFFLLKMFSRTLSLTQENRHFIVQIGKINAVNGQNYQEHALHHITQLTITSRLA
jgi:hypothetical protein